MPPEKIWETINDRHQDEGDYFLLRSQEAFGENQPAEPKFI